MADKEEDIAAAPEPNDNSVRKRPICMKFPKDAFNHALFSLLFSLRSL